MIENVEVRPGSAPPYRVAIGKGLLESVGEHLKPLELGRKVCVLADLNTARLYGSEVLEALRESGFETYLHEIEPGERSKSLSTMAPLLSYLAGQRFERRDTLLALGGGVVGDLAGYAAASFLRGINFVQMPTSLLAMVDSSVGGKTGVNLPEGKNLVGAFYQPRIVLADTALLKTLPARELSAGMAEVIKTALIADTTLYEQVRFGIPADLVAVIKRCVEIKAQVVSEDEKELSGRRAILNFGHTIGHGIENAEGYGKILHGEAVAIGICAAARLSRLSGHCAISEDDEQGIIEAIKAGNLPAERIGLSPDAIKVAMTRDKKVANGRNRWVLLPKLGDAMVTEDVPAEHVEEALRLACGLD